MIRRSGQNTFELALLIAVVCAALIAMSIYFKRSAMGRYREGSDQLGEQFSVMNVTGDHNKTIASNRQDVSDGTGVQTMTLNNDVNTTVTTEVNDTGLDGEKLFTN